MHNHRRRRNIGCVVGKVPVCVVASQKKRRSVCKNDTIAYRPPRGTEGVGRQPCHDGTIAWLPPVLRGCCLVWCLGVKVATCGGQAGGAV